MKVIFLDIDGVLNCGECFKSHRDDWEAKGKPEVSKRWNMLEPVHIQHLNRIITETGAKIVISSSWRGDANTNSELINTGVIGEIIGDTPRMPKMGGAETMERGYEIQAWLDKHPEVDKFAILDDDSDMLPHQPLFKTSFKTGLTQEVADQVIKHLNQ